MHFTLLIGLLVGFSSEASKSHFELCSQHLVNLSIEEQALLREKIPLSDKSPLQSFSTSLSTELSKFWSQFEGTISASKALAEKFSLQKSEKLTIRSLTSINLEIETQDGKAFTIDQLQFLELLLEPKDFTTPKEKTSLKREIFYGRYELPLGLSDFTTATPVGRLSSGQIILEIPYRGSLRYRTVQENSFAKNFSLIEASNHLQNCVGQCELQEGQIIYVYRPSNNSVDRATFMGWSSRSGFARILGEKRAKESQVKSTQIIVP